MMHVFAPSFALLYLLVRRCICHRPHLIMGIRTTTLVHLTSSMAFQGSQASG